MTRPEKVTILALSSEVMRSAEMDMGPLLLPKGVSTAQTGQGLNRQKEKIRMAILKRLVMNNFITSISIGLS
jgi:hypothetical protein